MTLANRPCISSKVATAPFGTSSNILLNHDPSASLSRGTLEALDGITQVIAYPEGVVIFMEGYAASGVFILCEGRVKLVGTSREGKAFILKISQPGEILGLHDVIAGGMYTFTAETLQPSQLAFISASPFLALMKRHGDVCLFVCHQSIGDCTSAYELIRSIGWADSVTEKLACLLLKWSVDGPSSEGIIQLNHGLTHEELAQLVGSSRETVTRILGELKINNVLEQRADGLVIVDLAALKRLAARVDRPTSAYNERDAGHLTLSGLLAKNLPYR